ncbi:hypothetical protein J6590_090942 [Homalodisca vitripennis]|nr:hypothetical protein J6590_090942 [Homalodisca vitripennis]
MNPLHYGGLLWFSEEHFRGKQGFYSLESDRGYWTEDKSVSPTFAALSELLLPATACSSAVPYRPTLPYRTSGSPAVVCFLSVRSTSLKLPGVDLSSSGILYSSPRLGPILSILYTSRRILSAWDSRNKSCINYYSFTVFRTRSWCYQPASICQRLAKLDMFNFWSQVAATSRSRDSFAQAGASLQRNLTTPVACQRRRKYSGMELSVAEIELCGTLNNNARDLKLSPVARYRKLSRGVSTSVNELHLSLRYERFGDGQSTFSREACTSVSELTSSLRHLLMR